MFEFYDETYIRSARKSHICECCGRAINLGESYYQEKGKFDGDFFFRCLHPVCHGMEVEYCCEVDNEFTWDDIVEYVRDTVCGMCSRSNNDDFEFESTTECPYYYLQDCPEIVERFMPKEN